MTTPYEETPYEPGAEAAPRRGMSPWLIAAIVVLVLIAACFLCVCAAILFLGPVTGNVFSTIIETVEAITPVP
jgi:hypothetical protein